MEVVNPFILKNKERMIVFLDQLSSVTDPNPPPGCMIEQTNPVLSSSDAGKCYALHDKKKNNKSTKLSNRTRAGHDPAHLRVLPPGAAVDEQDQHFAQKARHRHGDAVEAQAKVPRDD